MSNPTRWGVVGAGRISHDFVVCLRSMSPEEHKVVAVAGRNFEKAKQFADLHSISKAYSSYEELALDPDVEVAYVGSLHPDHYTTSRMLLESGKHVLCEKPLTSSRKDTEALCEVAKEKGLFLMEALWSRFLPSYRRLQEELERGSIGEPRYVHVTAGYPMQGLQRVFRKELGGSAVLTMGTYTTNLILQAFGPEFPVKITASGDFTDEGVDTVVAGTVIFSGGRLATFAMSSIFNMPSTAEIVGTNGTITLDPPSPSPRGMQTPAGRMDFPFPPVSMPLIYEFSAGLRYEAEEVRSCLLRGAKESPLMTHKDSILIASVLDEILKQIGVKY
ncbi:trans-1,2-dihydrobenzene-1,2-diol dehydrogenase-like [Dermacentor albipictus]|uniref:trans-1,2-dihydrobenzene-1,2-diol dehydrogenase-like n=1 Tax=Dermacentor albipictus TaxID=60249 RepID=UPI0038FC74C9